ncbi:deacylase [Parvularcula lutaonensis]|nr:deacylase [Parvularcula lutaonensis]
MVPLRLRPGGPWDRIMSKAPRKPFVIHGEEIAPGRRRTIDIPLSRLADHTRMHLGVQVIHGKSSGPVLFVSGAIHGDEIIGVEIIRRLSEVKALSRLKGTLILVPIVNAYGFITHSRYLPDRRDLNRSFPGAEKGSLAAQLAHIFMKEVVSRSDFGIDLHSAAVHRDNFPQIRANLGNPEVLAMARAFGATIMLDSRLRDGSLRAEGQERGCDILLYEAGEALRFNETAIRIGVKGVLNVMRHKGMLPPSKGSKPAAEPIRTARSHWERAPIGGIMRAYRGLGDSVDADELLAVVSGPLGEDEMEVRARSKGVVIGRSNLPIVNRGDALFHIAETGRGTDVDATHDAIEAAVEADPLFDGMEIVCAPENMRMALRSIAIDSQDH